MEYALKREIMRSCAGRLAIGIVLLAVSASHAQINRGRIDRPSDELSRGLVTGGSFSGQRGSVLNDLPSRAQAGPSAFAVDLAAAGGTTRAANVGGYLALPDIVDVGSLGVFAPGANRGARSIRQVGISGDRLWQISGMELATSRWLPIGGTGPMTPPMTRGMRAPDYEGSLFRQHFGLAASEEPVGAGEPMSMAEHLEASNARATRADERAALEYFKRGTTPKEPKRTDFLAAADRKLRAVRDADRAAYIPSLLLAHIALERRQYVSAVRFLDEALQRNPNLFIDLTQDDIFGYFGAREALELTIRANSRVGENNPQIAGTFGLQAYCQWLGNDVSAIKGAFDLAEKARRSSGVRDQKSDRVRFALQAGIWSRPTPTPD